MPTNRRPTSRQYTAWLVVIGGHLLLALFIATSPSPYVRVGASSVQERVQLRVLVFPAPPLLKNPSIGRRRLLVSDTRRLIVPNQPLAETPEFGPSAPQTDWYREGQRAAKAAVQTQKPAKRDCDEVETPGSMRPSCVKPRRFEWHPNPKIVEFDGLIPYVHLGKRCVLGLGFFGCALGRLPDANGHLLDEMKDPDRPRSSVPDSPR